MAKTLSKAIRNRPPDKRVSVTLLSKLPNPSTFLFCHYFCLHSPQKYRQNICVVLLRPAFRYRSYRATILSSLRDCFLGTLIRKYLLLCLFTSKLLNPCLIFDIQNRETTIQILCQINLTVQLSPFQRHET